jgi:hypothetical protein
MDILGCTRSTDRSKTQILNGIELVEISSKKLANKNMEDGLDVMGNRYYHGYDRKIIHKKKIITPSFT